MKKHLCRPKILGSKFIYAVPEKNMGVYAAACDEFLMVPYYSRKDRNKRLSAEEIVKQMYRPDVCKACIRIVVVERLNGIRPDTELDPRSIFANFVKIIEAADNLDKAMKTVGNIMDKAPIHQPKFKSLKKTLFGNKVVGEVTA